MSKGRKPTLPETDDKPIYISNLSLLDRIKGHYLDKVDLDENDEKYRLILARINHWFEEGENISGARQKLIDEDKIKESEAHYIVSDALELYGDIGKSNKEGLRNILTNRLLRLATKSEEEKSFFTAGQILERVARLNGLSESTEQNKRSGKRVPISYSRDPKALKKKEA